LIEKYNAEPHSLLPHELDVLKANVIMNHFHYILTSEIGNDFFEARRNIRLNNSGFKCGHIKLKHKNLLEIKKEIQLVPI